MIHLGQFNPRRALLRIEINRNPPPGTKRSQIDVPVVCLQCDPAPCSEVCPENAIQREPAGYWKVDRDRCTGCGLCVEACSFGMIAVDIQEGKAWKCDMCEGSPACVTYCPMGALTF